MPRPPARAEEPEESEDSMSEDEQEEDEDLRPDGTILYDFDVNQMFEGDLFPVMNLLDPAWPIDVGINPDSIESLANLMLASPHTSVLKQCDGEDEFTEDVHGAASLVDITKNAQSECMKHLIQCMHKASQEQQVTGDYFNQLFNRGQNIALMVSERFPLTYELSIHMLDQCFREYAGHRASPGGTEYEYFIKLCRVTPHPEGVEDEGEGDHPEGPARGGSSASGAGGKRGKKRSREERDEGSRKHHKVGDFTARLTSAHFVQPEEWYFWEHRDKRAPVLCLSLPQTTGQAEEDAAAAQPAAAGAPLSGHQATSAVPGSLVQPGVVRALSDKVVCVPVIIHKSKMKGLLDDLHSLDAYFANSDSYW